MVGCQAVFFKGDDQGLMPPSYCCPYDSTNQHKTSSYKKHEPSVKQNDNRQDVGYDPSRKRSPEKEDKRQKIFGAKVVVSAE